MVIIEDIRPVSYLKSRAGDILEQINETHRPVFITQNGEPRAVLQDPGVSSIGSWKREYMF
jgi:prevent-host-death family protein